MIAFNQIQAVGGMRNAYELVKSEEERIEEYTEENEDGCV